LLQRKFSPGVVRYLSKMIIRILARSKYFSRLPDVSYGNSLKQTSAHQVDTRSDLLGLKTTLEVEILEQVSREAALEQH
jgi:hypothetical protein